MDFLGFHICINKDMIRMKEKRHTGTSQHHGCLEVTFKCRNCDYKEAAIYPEIGLGLKPYYPMPIHDDAIYHKNR